LKGVNKIPGLFRSPPWICARILTALEFKELGSHNFSGNVQTEATTAESVSALRFNLHPRFGRQFQ